LEKGDEGGFDGFSKGQTVTTFAVLFPVEKQACGPEVSPKEGLPGRARPEIQFIFRLLGEK
jgi:hypothetical protein